MMKKTLLAACAALLLPALCAQAQTVTVDGIEYWLFRNSKTAKAASYYGNATEIAIPATVEYENTDYTVTTIGSGLFYDQRDLESVTLPSGITKIQSNAFGSCYSLTHIDLPEGLETIDFDAFMFSGLQGNIDLPEGLKEIGMQAFYDCSSLSSVTLPSTLEDIGKSAFASCPLEDITCKAATPPVLGEKVFDATVYANASLHVPDGTEDAYRQADGWKAFFGTAIVDDIEYTIDTETGCATLTNCFSTLETLVIPSTIEYRGTAYPVTAIGSEAFSWTLEDITLPASITTIHDYAFSSNWSDLQDITCLAATPPTLGKEAFNALTYERAMLHVPAEAEMAYTVADGWKEFYLHPLVDSIRYAIDLETQTATAISYEEGLKEAIVQASVSYNGADYPVTAIADNMSRFYHTLQSVALPEGLKRIGTSAFEECPLESIILPSTLESIGQQAFRACPLRDITCNALIPPALGEGAFSSNVYPTAILHIPAEAEDAYRQADGWKEFFLYPVAGGIRYAIDPETQTASVFGYVGSITDAAIAASITEAGTSYPVTSIGRSAFASCMSLASVTVPKGITSIGNNAFYDCEMLKDVTLPEGLQSIGTTAFNSCDALDSINIPQSVASIGNHAFSDCWKLQTIVLHEGLQSIGENAFSNCALLDSIDIPRGVASIGDRAFFRCEALKDVILHEGLQSIGVSAFGYCISLDSIDMPQGVTDIKENAFTACRKLVHVALPSSLTVINYHTFDGCTSLTKIALPEGIIYISDNAFSGCSSLECITLPDGLQSIGSFAFSGCHSLESIALPSTLEAIGIQTFYDCPLVDVYCHATTPPSIKDNTFDESTYQDALLHVPSGTIGDYQAATGWMNFSRIGSDLPNGISAAEASDESLARYASGILTTGSPANVTVYAQNGAIVLRDGHVTTLSLNSLPRGLYIICVEQSGQRQVLKVLR